MSKPHMDIIERSIILSRYKDVDTIMHKHVDKCCDCHVNKNNLELCRDITVEIMTQLYTIDTTVMDVLLSGAPMDKTVLQYITQRLQWDDNTNEIDDEHR